MSTWLVFTLAVIGIAMVIVPILFVWVVYESRRDVSAHRLANATSKRAPDKSA